MIRALLFVVLQAQQPTDTARLAPIVVTDSMHDQHPQCSAPDTNTVESGAQPVEMSIQLSD